MSTEKISKEINGKLVYIASQLGTLAAALRQKTLEAEHVAEEMQRLQKDLEGLLNG